MKTLILSLMIFANAMTAQAATPAIPHTGEVLIDLGNRLSFSMDNLPGINSSLCSQAYHPIDITAHVELKIGNEVYLAKKWYCVSSAASGQLDGITIQADHSEFHQTIFLNVYPTHTEVVENHSIRPTKVTSYY